MKYSKNKFCILKNQKEDYKEFLLSITNCVAVSLKNEKGITAFAL